MDFWPQAEQRAKKEAHRTAPLFEFHSGRSDHFGVREAAISHWPSFVRASA
jgi:hypothetical protein